MTEFYDPYQGDFEERARDVQRRIGELASRALNGEDVGEQLESAQTELDDAYRTGGTDG